MRLGAIYLNKQRVLDPVPIREGDYLRVHPQPKRYLVDTDLVERIVAETPDYFIVDKPAGLPVHPTLDNIQENLVAALQRVTATTLFVTQRLDIATSGLVLIARTAAFQTLFNRLLAERRVQKTYRALSEKQPREGLWRHFMARQSRIPKKLYDQAYPDALECLTEARLISPSPWYHVELKPCTGRTHQLRAQMAFEGSPILGDVLYGGSVAGEFRSDRIALHSYSLGFELGNRSYFYKSTIELNDAAKVPSPETQSP